MATIKKVKKAQEGIKSGGKQLPVKPGKQLPPGMKSTPKPPTEFVKSGHKQLPVFKRKNSTPAGPSKPAGFDDFMSRGYGSKLKAGGKVTKAKTGKQMIKRADGTYSQRGLWDNIRANKGSGKKPTAAMLKQEKKIKAKTKK